MNNSVLRYLLLFIILVFLQAIIFNHINFWGYINPMIYIVWVFLFPIRKTKSLFLILSFLLGLSIDIFTDAGGINAAATLFIAYFRLPLLRVILRKHDFDYFLFNVRAISFGKSLLFIFLLTLMHHLVVFTLEYFSFNDYSEIISKSFTTTLFTVVICVLGIILFTKKK